jgi:AGZA family xanthine/uracil permease-like MFS transporter
MALQSSPHLPTRYQWAAWGDVNAFFGLMLDNVAVLIILFSVVTSTNPIADRAFSQEFVLTHMIPGTALGVLIGDLVYTWMAFRLARRTGRTDVTAMPLGLDTPSAFGVALLVLLPTLKEQLRDLPVDPAAASLVHQNAMLYAWQVAAVVLVMIGVFKVLCAPLGSAVRRLVPRAGLLGSLAAIALALISFMPLLQDIAPMPIVGFLALTVILVTLVAHRGLPGNIPGALAAVILGVLAYYVCKKVGEILDWRLVAPLETVQTIPWRPPELFRALDWQAVWQGALAKLPVALPFALATVVGGIDCTESAAAAGDEYDTRTILLTEGLASVIAGLAGGVLQNTPYIGQPAYKAMGGRAAYTLATALFVGAAGYFGWFAHLFDVLPPAAMFPILVFVGLEITAQSFRATPSRHYPALALAVLPALAYLALIPLKTTLPPNGAVPDHAAVMVQTLRCLANGFIVTSLLWGAALAALLDGRYRGAAAYLAVAGGLALVGIIHSPLPAEAIGLPGDVLSKLAELPTTRMREVAQFQTPYHWAAAYGLAAVLLVVLGVFDKRVLHPAGELPAQPHVEEPTALDRWDDRTEIHNPVALGEEPNRLLRGDRLS